MNKIKLHWFIKISKFQINAQITSNYHKRLPDQAKAQGEIQTLRRPINHQNHSERQAITKTNQPTKRSQPIEQRNRINNKDKAKGAEQGQIQVHRAGDIGEPEGSGGTGWM